MRAKLIQVACVVVLAFGLGPAAKESSAQGIDCHRGQPDAIVPNDFPTIQQAVDAIGGPKIPEGGIIEVLTGTYVENVVITKPVTLRSRDFRGALVKSAGNGPIFWIKRVRRGPVNICSFVFFEGDDATNGGGIYAERCFQVVVQGNQFIKCKATVAGGGVAIEGTDGAVVFDNEFKTNEAVRLGGGLAIWSVPLQEDHVFGPSPFLAQVQDNIFIENKATDGAGGGIGLAGDSVEPLAFAPGSAGGVCVEMEGNTIEKNEARLATTPPPPPPPPPQPLASTLATAQTLGSMRGCGGGLFAQGIRTDVLITEFAVVIFNNHLFKANQAGVDGGGMAVAALSEVRLLPPKNEKEKGIKGNTAARHGGGIFVGTLAQMSYGEPPSPEPLPSSQYEISGNSAGGQGGSPAGNGGGAAVVCGGILEFQRNVVLHSNSAGAGGGIWCANACLRFVNQFADPAGQTRLQNNHAVGSLNAHGGGVLVETRLDSFIAGDCADIPAVFSADGGVFRLNDAAGRGGNFAAIGGGRHPGLFLETSRHLHADRGSSGNSTPSFIGRADFYLEATGDSAERRLPPVRGVFPGNMPPSSTTGLTGPYFSGISGHKDEISVVFENVLADHISLGAVRIDGSRRVVDTWLRLDRCDSSGGEGFLHVLGDSSLELNSVDIRRTRGHGLDFDTTTGLSFEARGPRVNRILGLSIVGTGFGAPSDFIVADAAARMRSIGDIPGPVVTQSDELRLTRCLLDGTAPRVSARFVQGLLSNKGDDVSIFYSHIFGHTKPANFPTTGAGVFNANAAGTGTNLNARENWWGSKDGPFVPATGKGGDAVVGPVTTFPFQTAPR